MDKKQNIIELLSNQVEELQTYNKQINKELEHITQLYINREADVENFKLQIENDKTETPLFTNEEYIKLCDIRSDYCKIKKAFLNSQLEPYSFYDIVRDIFNGEDDNE